MYRRVLSLDRNDDRVAEVRMCVGSLFQTVGAAIENELFLK